MGELIRNSDVAILATAEMLLREAGIPHHIADRHMAVLDGSLPFIRPRVLVPDEFETQARELLNDAGLGEHLS